MKSFEYTAKDKLGVHARPAGLLVKKAATYESKISLTKGEKTADAKRLFGIMSLAIKQGETMIFTIVGPDEESACEQLLKFCEVNF